MTPREILAKYGLATDVKSIRERLYNHTLYLKQLAKSFPQTTQGAHDAIDAIEIVRKADLDLLCEMAEKVAHNAKQCQIAYENWRECEEILKKIGEVIEECIKLRKQDWKGIKDIEEILKRT